MKYNHEKKELQIVRLFRQVKKSLDDENFRINNLRFQDLIEFDSTYC